MQWIRLESIEAVDPEWTALAITLFSIVLAVKSNSLPAQTPSQTRRKSRKGHLRSSSGAQIDSDKWDRMYAEETSYGNPAPSWAGNAGWKWLTEDENAPFLSHESMPTAIENGSHGLSFVQKHVKLAREFANTKFGFDSMSSCLPTSGSNNQEVRKDNLSDIFIGIHLLREEQKLNTLNADSFNSGSATLVPILAQLSRWLGWDSWMQYYEAEEASLLDADYDAGKFLSLTAGHS